MNNIDAVAITDRFQQLIYVFPHCFALKNEMNLETYFQSVGASFQNFQKCLVNKLKHQIQFALPKYTY